jgi:sulfite reductase alpha subunit-like flavoprotein
MQAAQTVHTYATGWILGIKPWNPDLPVTVVDGEKPRHTRESHEGGQASARTKLEQLVQALQSPDDTPAEFAEGYSSLMTAIFAMDGSTRLRLAEEFQAKLDEHPASA